MRIVLFVYTLIALGALLFCSGCRQRSPDAFIFLHPKIEASQLIVAGKTNLADGAVLDYQIDHDSTKTASLDELHELHRQGFSVTSAPLQLHTVVSNNEFRFTCDVSKFPPGNIEIWVAFQPFASKAEQPSEILTRYGVKGEYLTGAYVVNYGELGNRLECMQDVTYHPGTSLQQ
ncbi:MAG TPA: hypothetical protein VGL77_15605 [Armatimonadota bacterium]|jgi:hypothetical protein